MKSSTRLSPISLLSSLFVVAIGMYKAKAASSQVVMKSYEVYMSINTRFASTQITTEWTNNQNCTALYDWQIPIPTNARATSLTVLVNDDFDANDHGCTVEGTVQDSASAEDYLQESSSMGRSAAVLAAWDTENYNVRVSIPPHKKTTVQFKYEEVLRRVSETIPFSIPMPPQMRGEEDGYDVVAGLNNLSVSLSVQEKNERITNLELDSNVRIPISDLLDVETYNIATFTLMVANLDLDPSSFKGYLPQQIRGNYDSSAVPEDGLLLVSPKSDCFVHLFNPTGTQKSSTVATSRSLLGPIERNIVFVIDISGSMFAGKLEETEHKLNEAKKAFEDIVESLQVQRDMVAIHSFSDEGTETSYGPSRVSSKVVQDATDFILGLEADGGSNLYSAYLNGLQRLIEMENERPEALPILLVLTDGKPTEGETNPERIAQAVIDKNADLQAKIYGIAYGEEADENLLWALSWPTTGSVARIHEGFGDSPAQISDFYKGELGKVVLAETSFHLETSNGTSVMDGFETTRAQFAVVAEGTETVVRGRSVGSSVNGSTLVAVTDGTSVEGPQTWQAVATQMITDHVCSQSMIYAKITELLNFQKAALAAPDAVSPWAPFDVADGDDLAALAEERALDMALEGQLVWPGLTSLIATDKDDCYELTDASTSSNDGICARNDILGVDESSSAGTVSLLMSALCAFGILFGMA